VRARAARAAAISGALLTLLCSSGAAAFDTLKQGGNHLRWPGAQPVVEYQVNPEGAGVVGAVDAVRAGFEVWNDVAGAAITFRFDRETNVHSPLARDGRNLVLWVERGWDPSIGDDALAVCLTQRRADGEIYEADIAFNAQEYLWSTQGRQGRHDIQAVGAHEAGHFFGLGHTIERESIMYFAGGGARADQRELSDDDERGITFLYPRRGYSGGQPCDACDDNSDCGGADDWCVDLGPGAYCGRECDGNRACPAGFVCYSLNNGGPSQCYPNADLDAGNYPHCDQDGRNGAVGDFCWGHETCESTVCLVTPDAAYCTELCPRGRCPGGYECIGEGEHAICAQPGELRIGEVCQSHTDCDSLMCAVLEGDDGLCTQECEGVGDDCPDGSACVRYPMAGWYCAAGGELDYGDPCEDDGQCATGLCMLVAAGSRVCTQTCDALRSPCPDGAPCREAEGLGSICLPGAARVEGEPCEGADACVDGLVCYDAGAGGVCTRGCAPLGRHNCPGGTGCRAVDAERGVCVPDGGDPAGQSCSLDDDRETCAPEAVCVEGVVEGAVCLQYCSTEEDGRPSCPAGRRCYGLGPGLAPLGVCPLEDGRSGDPCASFVDCASAVCTATPLGQICSDLCDPDGAHECPEGFGCERGPGGGLCVQGGGEGEGEGEGEG